MKQRALHKTLLLGGLLAGIALTFFVITQPTISDTKTAKVALLQGNMPVITEYNHKRMQLNLQQYDLLTESVLEEMPDLDVIIWPESAVPYIYVEAHSFFKQQHKRQQQHHFDLVSGVTRANMSTGDVYNSVVLQLQNTQSPQFYDKFHLLPFGEYLPFRSIFSIFKEYASIPMSDFAHGHIQQKPFVIKGMRFAPSICFEAVFGDEIRHNAGTADALINISNDAWFGQSKAQSQHFNIARMRAIEHQKYLVRATNDGITAIVKPNGKVESSMPSFQTGYVTGIIHASDKLTWYAQYGDTPWLVFFVLWLVVMRFATRLTQHKPTRTR